MGKVRTIFDEYKDVEDIEDVDDVADPGDYWDQVTAPPSDDELEDEDE